MEMGEEKLNLYLADTVYKERHRLQQEKDHFDDSERDAIETLARSLLNNGGELTTAAEHLVRSYSHEIHNRFSERTFGAATKLLPTALNRLLSPSGPSKLLGAGFDAASRIVVQGPVEQIRSLSKNHTLVYAPTHLSNLDSPLLGYALHAAGLPPCIYGAGLNLFTNPAMGFFMSRLGAYTVDRRKKHQLYKDVLKAYSTELIGLGAHSLFFPGGTRSRSGIIENNLKRGLLGTAITAWQEGLVEQRDNPEIIVVPCTITFSLVLEAETLIEDALAMEGKARYIITDDEFSEPSTVMQYGRKVLNTDSSVIVRFGNPIDLIGNMVDESGRSMDNHGRSFDRKDYVSDRNGELIRDLQRDRMYTNQLAQSLCKAYQQDNVVLPTHLAALAGWSALKQRYPRLDTYQMVLLSPHERWVDRGETLAILEHLLKQLRPMEEEGRVHTHLPETAEALLQDAIDTFGRFHRRPALAFEDWRILVDPKLALYYSNRLLGYQLKPTEKA
jgi:glycerol-3-phosphate O-acyltransferase